MNGPMKHRVASPETLLAQAQSYAGIDTIDRDAIAPLTVLVRALNSESNLHEVGATAMRERLVRLLSNRLRMQRDFAAHPQIGQERVISPVFICGMARTGSTKTQKMLAASGDFNWLSYWKVFNPSLRTGDRSESPQLRIDDADKFTRWFDSMSPETKRAHPFETHEPEEESFILEHSLRTPTFLGWAPIDSYLAWLFTQDMSAQFEHLRDTLKYLQWQGLADPAKRWVLKSPLYSGMEPLLLKIFPDARLVMTHRHPQKTIASGLKLPDCFYMPYTSAKPDVENYVQGQASGSRAHLQCRAALPADTFLDLEFSELVGNVRAAIDKIYRFADQPLKAQALARIEAWNAANPANKRGAHVYSLEQYGLTHERVADLFEDYIRFLEQRFLGV
jgi:hypothetical protein